MNRYPLWKYLVVAVALLVGLIYTLPNFFGESPAVQISSAKSTVRITPDMMERVGGILDRANLSYTGLQYDEIGPVGTVRARFPDTDVQLQARDVLEQALNPDPNDPSYVVALNLLPASPEWLSALNAKPMYLGLDLRGGVHFLLQVDMEGALSSRYDTLVSDVRTTLRNANITAESIERSGNGVEIVAGSQDQAGRINDVLRSQLPELQVAPAPATDGAVLVASLTPQAMRSIQENALRQNISTLYNRINELGVAEPVIQQQGSDRIVVQLPGVQDVARAKEILGRTATLQVRLVDDSPQAQDALLSGRVPFGLERYEDANGQPLLLRRQVVLTGENLQDAQAGFDENQQPAVHLTLDAKGSRIFRDVTRDNIGNRMAILLFERDVGEVVTAPVIRSEIGGGRVQISGSMNTTEANNIALLLRAGSLAAPMEIIEERTVGPSLGAENIQQGFNATLWGFIAVAIFMISYYALMGLFSVMGLLFNLLLLFALLSILQATLTLPGLAAVALTLGMAIDANVLINERIREELKAGRSPHQAIAEGFDRAWGTIVDSNLTSLIAGVALLAFGSGPVRGFAVVHCLGILTSLFSAVIGVRAITNLWYGRKRKLTKISIG